MSQENLKNNLTELNELIHESYLIAQQNNHTFTHDEAKRYDPLISTLFKALQNSDELLQENHSYEI